MKTRIALIREMGLPAPYAESRPIHIEEAELDPPGAGEVLLKIHVAGLCHSDLSVINGSRPRVMPMALGHESSCEVLEVGPGVKDLKPGDHVVTVFVPTCGHCNPCMVGRPALCEPGAEANGKGVLLHGDRRIHLNNEEINHHLGVSCFSDYAVVSERSCVKIEEDITHREASLFGCAVLTGAGAVINRSGIKAGDSIAIVGLGGVGLSGLMAAVASGARRIVGVELDPGKRELAKQLGATHVIDPNAIKNTSDLIDAAGGRVDIGYDAAGVVPAFEAAYRLTRRGGVTVTSGLPHPNHAFNLPVAEMVGEERDVRGSYLGSGVPSILINQYISLYKAGKLPVDRLLGKSFKLEEINEGFDHLASGSGLRDSITLVD